jgi:PAS domain S-box-containing protein
MKIREKQRLNAWIALGVIVLMAFALAWSFRDNYRADQNTLLTDELRKTARDRVFLRDTYLLNPNERAEAAWYAKSEALRAILESASERIRDREERVILQEARKDFDVTFSSFSKLLIKRKQKEHADRKMLAIEADWRLISQVFLKAHSLNDSIDRLHESSRRAATRAQHRGTALLILFSVVSVAVIIVNSVTVRRTIVIRLAELNKDVEIIGRGNMDYRINEAGDDELSDLARASNKMVANLKASEDYSECIINTVCEPLIALDQDLRVVSASRSFYEFFKVNSEETVGQLIYDLGNKQWDIPKLRELLETILPQGTTFDNYEVEHEFSTIGRRAMLLNARQIQRALGEERVILLAIEDVTERKEIEAGLVKSKNNAEAANKELEAFSYSVSHDLRTPLRSIDGFSQVLLEDYQDKLDDTAKSYLNRIRKATQHMGLLIDDMLKLSQVARSELHHESVELSSIVRAISEKLQNDNPDRTVDLIVQKGVFVNGDPSLLQIVLENLIGNAWKFTSKEAQSQVEFGETIKEGKTACFVRDNGIGFDMAYSSKLFGAFQRLHTLSEFPGTGIGLATVQRIINRHGGQVWAEAEVGKGAQFYFTLPGQGTLAVTGPCN